MLSKSFLFSILTICFLACNNGTSQDAGDSTKTQSFGEEIEETGAIGYLELMERMEYSDSLSAKVAGTVTNVCQTKGCWITITPEKEGMPEIFVKFKDYGFFMPKDIAGRQIIMDGYAFKETTSVDELRHYAEDEGLSKEEIAKITEPEEQFKFMASGVLLLPKS